MISGQSIIISRGAAEFSRDLDLNASTARQKLHTRSARNESNHLRRLDFARLELFSRSRSYPPNVEEWGYKIVRRRRKALILGLPWRISARTARG